MDVNSPSLELDAVFSILDTRRRRTTLAVLADHRKTLSLADLADEVAVREHDTTITNLSPTVVDEISRSLYHNHVPVLADAGLVAYDRERDRVTATGRLDELEPFLSMALETERVEEPVPTADWRETDGD